MQSKKRSAPRKEERVNASQVQRASNEPSTKARQPRKKKNVKGRDRALIIKPIQGKTYADILKEMRTKADPTVSETEIKTIRQTKAGHVLVQFSPNAKNIEIFRESLKEALGDNVEIRNSQPNSEVEIRDLDSFTTTEEVKHAIEKVTGSLDNNVQIHITKENSIGVKMAIVRMCDKTASELLKIGNIKIGWVSCRMRKRAVVLKCYKCFDYGHTQSTCTAPDRRQLDMCLRCCERGHKRVNCQASPKCFVYTERKLNVKQRNHAPGTGECQAFREALLKAREKLRV